ncbi:MAG: winged helix-turn-helix domain-containing protein [Planctomycetota bacterium]|jgi:transposase
MHVKPHHPHDLEELRDRGQREREARQRDRYRAVLLALEGHRTETIMHTLARSKNFVQRWVYAYRDSGLEAIRPKRPSGRPPKLPVSQEASFKERFLSGPTQGDGVCTLHAREARRILEEEFGVHYTLAGVYDLLHRLGLSCLAPRPRHRKNDPKQMQAWWEQAPLLSRESARNGATSASQSGSRTRHGSAGKEP